jgi:transposase
MGQLRFEDPSLQIVLEQYRLSLDQALEQLKTFDQEVEALAQRPEFARLTRCLMGFRGIRAITAMTILAEAIDLRRYVSAPALMSAIGLVPSEYSTGAKERRGSITKTGNAHMRRVVVEASWHYRHSPIASKALKQRRRDLPPEMLRLVQRADQRLHKKFRKLVNKGKPSTVAAVAVARELAGFIWAAGQAA